MSSGLGNIDLVEILFTLFWLFFIVLVLYLHREGKREGYPLVSDRSDHVTVQGFPAMPDPKTFFLDDGRTVQKPAAEAPEEHFSAEPAASYPGAPFNPVGDPMKSGFGTGSWAKRSEVPEKTLDGKPRIIPMRADASLEVDQRDTDPRGMTVVAGDGVDVGTVSDLWIDLAEPQIYYLEVDRSKGGKAMVPFGFAEIDKRAGVIRVNVIHSKHFDDVPQIASPDQITPLEEDKICGYFGGGLLFADSKRAEPYL
ncbi:MAG: photosynthetic reaction center subunit H [Woeseiaceae bacterium]|jgi:photosynthetic reaction center H subunit|nr:photosynthetic reaction center subunit H [Woeseiaceae bacterium]